jgi:hypothetical protein
MKFSLFQFRFFLGGKFARTRVSSVCSPTMLQLFCWRELSMRRHGSKVEVIKKKFFLNMNYVEETRIRRPKTFPDDVVYVADIEINIPAVAKSRRKELDDLFERGVFEVVDISTILQNCRTFKARFVDEVKFSGTNKAYEKSRLVVQGYDDRGKKEILTQSPTIQRASQRPFIMLQRHEHNLYDISQAYTQSSTHLNRDVFIKPPSELRLQTT